MNEQPKKTQNRGIGKFKPAAKDSSGKNYLFSIAIDEYENFPKLFNCVKDAKDIVDMLTSKYQFEEQNVFRLYNQEATTDNIFQKFEMLAKKVTPVDSLIIYFAGHGEFKKVFNEGYWIPANAQNNKTSHYIPNSEIKTMLTAINTKHTFLIADSCFSGSLFARGATRSIAERVERFPSRWGLTSFRSEIVADGSPGVNSPFAASILYLLRNNTKQLGVQELCAHVIESVISNAIQTPIGEPLTIPGHKGGQFVFRLKKNEARDWAATLEAGDLKAYETFVALYPGGENIQKASETLIRLKEEKLWEEVKEANTIKAYITYKKQYPNGKFVDLAIERIEDLEDERDWKIACRQNRISAYMKYKRNYPDGTFVAEADAKIKELEQGRPIQNEETSHQGGGVIVETPSIKIETKPSKEEVPAGLSGAGSADISYEHQTTPGKKVYDSKFIKFGLPAIILAIFLAIKFFPGNSDPKITEATTPITDLTNKGAETGTTPEREKPLENPTDESTKTPERESGKNESTNPPTRRPELDLKTDFKPKTEIDRSIRPTITTKEETKLEIEKPKLPAPVLELNNSMIKIPVGQFVMGTETQKDAPIHQVTLSRRFAISKNEVTQELWKAVMGNAPSKRKNCAQCPVENVSFYDVQEFLKKLYQMTGKKYRLPTEAEWEFAASGGKNPDLAYVKASNLNRLAYYGANSGNKTNPVASKRPNKFGLYDMLGNVQEWCLDWYDEGFYKDGQKNPYNRNKGIAASKVIRGGSYLTVGEKVRVFKRSAMSPSQKRPTIGFRVVLD